MEFTLDHLSVVGESCHTHQSDDPGMWPGLVLF